MRLVSQLDCASSRSRIWWRFPRAGFKNSCLTSSRASHTRRQFTSFDFVAGDWSISRECPPCSAEMRASTSATAPAINLTLYPVHGAGILTLTIVRLAGATSGQVYLVTNRVTMDSGQVLDASILIRCQEQ